MKDVLLIPAANNSLLTDKSQDCCSLRSRPPRGKWLPWRFYWTHFLEKIAYFVKPESEAYRKERTTKWHLNHFLPTSLSVSNIRDNDIIRVGTACNLKNLIKLVTSKPLKIPSKSLSGGMRYTGTLRSKRQSWVCQWKRQKREEYENSYFVPWKSIWKQFIQPGFI